MAEGRPPPAPEYRRRMICPSPWCGRVARPGSCLAGSSAPRGRSAPGSVRPRARSCGGGSSSAPWRPEMPAPSRGGSRTPARTGTCSDSWCFGSPPGSFHPRGSSSEIRTPDPARSGAPHFAPRPRGETSSYPPVQSLPEDGGAITRPYETPALSAKTAIMPGKRKSPPSCKLRSGIPPGVRRLQVRPRTGPPPDTRTCPANTNPRSLNAVDSFEEAMYRHSAMNSSSRLSFSRCLEVSAPFVALVVASPRCLRITALGSGAICGKPFWPATSPIRFFSCWGWEYRH